ncbi:hypothetical protein ACOSQ2_015099 [Xanthoceras sorbifolium]
MIAILSATCAMYSVCFWYCSVQDCNFIVYVKDCDFIVHVKDCIVQDVILILLCCCTVESLCCINVGIFMQFVGHRWMNFSTLEYYFGYLINFGYCYTLTKLDM